MIRSWSLVAVSLFALASPALGQGLPPFFPPFIDMRGTPEDQAACRSDAVKLCRHVLDQNDSMVVLACFQSQRAKLSRPCAAVLQKYGQ